MRFPPIADVARASEQWASLYAWARDRDREPIEVVIARGARDGLTPAMAIHRDAFSHDFGKAMVVSMRMPGLAMHRHEKRIASLPIWSRYGFGRTRKVRG